MILYLDTNILIDFVAKRQPFSQWAYRIFEKQKENGWELWTSCNSILDTYYIIEKEIGTNIARDSIEILLGRLNIQGLTKKSLILALNTSFIDYEDSVQYVNALEISDLNFIITRNKRDFKTSSIPILSSEELFA